MPISKATRLAALSNTPEQTEARFYEALQAADLDRLIECWAEDEVCICTMPSGVRVVGLEDIRSAFASIFEAGPIRVTPQDCTKSEGADFAIHSVLQHVFLKTSEGEIEIYLSATNVMRKTHLGWRFVAHHSSPAISEAAVSQAEARPSTLH